MTTNDARRANDTSARMPTTIFISYRMNLPKLSFSYIKQRTLSTLLNVVLLALGIATIVVLLLFSHQLEENLTKNAQGIDLVVGAKGSPLQLILSSIYHIDAPTGNIPVAEAEAVLQNPAVAEAIPLALGDSYQGYRMVGTTHAYAEHYGATVAAGTLWQDVMDVTVGADVAAARGISLGDELVSTHGLTAGGQTHGEQPLRVVGIFAPSGTVVDRLVLTSVETIWAVHGDHGDAEEAHAEEEGHMEEETHADDEAADAGEAAADAVSDTVSDTAAAPRPPVPLLLQQAQMQQAPPGGAPLQPGAGPPGREYTALLIKYASPMAAVMFPRFVNTQTDLQAAAPAFETARLLTLLGVGIDALRAFGIILILAAVLSVFIALYSALKARKYDLAIMRTLGASRQKLMAHVLLEGLILAGLGTLAGLLIGHVAASVLGGWVEEAQGVALTGWTFLPSEVWLIVIALGVGTVAALLPAWQAYRTDIAQTLARG